MDTAKLPEIIAWLAIGAAGAWLLLRLWSRFVPLRRGRLRRAALFAVLVAATTVVIWVGDHNLFFMGVPFFAAGLLCFGGPRLGRLTVTMIFFALTMSVDALLDTYLPGAPGPKAWRATCCGWACGRRRTARCGCCCAAGCRTRRRSWRRGCGGWWRGWRPCRCARWWRWSCWRGSGTSRRRPRGWR